MTTPAPGDRVDVTIRDAGVRNPSDQGFFIDLGLSQVFIPHGHNAVTVTPHTVGDAEGLDVEAIRDAIGEALSSHYDNQGLHPAIAKPFDAADAVMPIVRNIIADRDGARSYSAKLTAELKKARRPMTVDDEFEDLKSNMIYANAMDRAVDAALGVAKQRDALLAELDRLRATAGIEAAIEAGVAAVAEKYADGHRDAGLWVAYTDTDGQRSMRPATAAEVGDVAIRAAAVHLDAGRAELEAEVENLKWGVDDAEKYAKSLEKIRTTLSADLAAARARVADLEAQLAEVRTTIRALVGDAAPTLLPSSPTSGSK